ncbi:signal peptidase [Agromyces sp. 3263]|uniref:S26 family signal peptidase n=1 Tax=Agromyces sp. 3263 TaxID=2817750 RepID=UPI00285E31D4|nr:S26 family signal peptidase [Agromyces sp. 3263]MDR6905954.1 signal peptidase [Agromyces sp. 3263]
MTSVAGDALLTLAAIAGAACILLVVAALLFDVGIVLFRTGSMSPTIPAGSAALVREVPVGELHVGDVVTVDRPGRLPVTHRIVAIDDGGAGGARRLTLRGDANPVDDPQPYEVPTARIVLASVPGVAPVIGSMGHPAVIGGLTVGATALVVWAFWPRRRREPPPPPPVDPREPASTTATTASLVIALLAVAAATVAQAPMSASAAVEESVVQGQVLRLTAIGDPELMQRMTPGDTVAWEVGISADAPEPGTIDVGMIGSGDAGLGLVVEASWCAVRWTGGACDDPVPLLAPEPLPVDGVAQELLTMTTAEQRWIRFLVTMPVSGSDAAGLADLEVHAVGSGDEVRIGTAPGSGAGLGATGLDATVPIAAAAASACVGALLLRRARRLGR